jgi:hypothetical protein
VFLRTCGSAPRGSRGRPAAPGGPGRCLRYVRGPATGAYIPDRFDDPEDGRGFTWGLCRNGTGDRDLLLHFECDLHRQSPKQLAWKCLRHCSTVRDVMVDPLRFGVPSEGLRGRR